MILRRIVVFLIIGAMLYLGYCHLEISSTGLIGVSQQQQELEIGDSEVEVLALLGSFDGHMACGKNKILYFAGKKVRLKEDRVIHFDPRLLTVIEENIAAEKRQSLSQFLEQFMRQS